MQEMFRVSKYGCEITCHEVKKLTPKTITYISGNKYNDRKYEQMEHKHSDSVHWFECFDRAKEFLVARCELKVENSKKQLHRHRSELGNTKSIKQPSVILSKTVQSNQISKS